MRISKAPSSIQIAGEASVNDANHISGPSRTGAGLRKSIEAALKEAGMSPGNIDFISAHGTATVYNDEMEAVALDSLGMKPDTDAQPESIFRTYIRYGRAFGSHHRDRMYEK
ncbi:MAG: hypothetical protein KL787_02425 [Taibaiella sp.]|nr:hypothetical protein [Taibaiella sp.]